jgi:thioredoxin reductase
MSEQWDVIVIGGVLVTTEQATALHARAVIVATGITDELPAIPGLSERWGCSVLHCPYCDGWEVRDQCLGVLTTSPLGFHQAQLIRQWSDRVIVFAAGLGALDPARENRLSSRGIELVAAPVTEVIGEGDQVTSQRTSDGRITEVDAIFTVDFAGKTSGQRIWAIGNVVSPMANVPLSIGVGSITGGAVNAALVEEDFNLALEKDLAHV